MADSWVELHNLALEVAGFFVVLSVSLSAYLILQHFTAFNKPEEQKCIVCCIFMVPAYSIDSWITLKYPQSALIFNLLRDCYEAYTIYAFGSFLIECMGGEDKVIQKLEANVEKVPTSQTPLLEAGYGGSRGPVLLYSRDELFYHPPPMCCLPPWRMGKQFYMSVKFGTVQYMILKVLCTLATWILSLAHVYGEGEFRWNRGYPYIATIINFSQMWALYCLVLMYQACKAELAPIRPLAKFLCIKGVIFFTYWQSVGISIAQATGLIHAQDSWTTYDTDDVVAGLQEFLICIEMFIAALAHAYAFPPRDYSDPLHPPHGLVRNLRKLFDVTDVVDDVQGIVDEQVQRTTDNLSQATHQSWRTAKRTSATVVAAPLSFLRWFKPAGRSRQATFDDEAGFAADQALLPYTHSASV